MNAKEGMRRVGLVAGVLGACVGSYVSYTYSVALLEQRHQHEEFQSLASSPVVRQEVLFLKNNLSLSKAAKTPRDASAKDPLHKAPEKVLADDDPNNPFNASKPGTPATPRPQDEFDAALKKPEPDEFDKILAKSDKSDKTKPGEIPSPVSAAGQSLVLIRLLKTLPLRMCFKKLMMQSMQSVGVVRVGESTKVESRKSTSGRTETQSHRKRRWSNGLRE